MKRRHRDKNYNRKFNDHHIVAKQLGGTNDPDNIQRHKILTHRAKHTIFATKSTVDKILQIIEEDITALQGDFVRDITRVLEVYRGLEYHDHVIKKPYHK